MAGGKASPYKMRLLERRTKALELRKEGLNYREIAAALQPQYPGYTYIQCFRDIVKQLENFRQRTAEVYDTVRDLELSRLDAMFAELWQKKNEPRTVEALLRIMERRARLLGLDAPVKADITSGGNTLVIEYVNDWRDAPAGATPWADGDTTVCEATELVECRSALAEDHNGNGRHR